eukprot:4582780-Amphidinium_carterae.1
MKLRLPCPWKKRSVSDRSEHCKSEHMSDSLQAPLIETLGLVIVIYGLWHQQNLAKQLAVGIPLHACTSRSAQT